MSSMTLAKIPCILVSFFSLRIALTPPTPPPAAEERAPSTRMESILGRPKGPVMLYSLYGLGGLSEIAAILASRNQDWWISHNILATLVPLDGTEGNIYFSPWFLFGIVMCVLAGYVRYRCYHELGKMFTYQMSIRKDHKLITSGPYAVVRHPGYTGIAIAVVGMIFSLLCPGSWLRECGFLNTVVGKSLFGVYSVSIALMVVGLFLRMFKEDEVLAKEFGVEWTAWAKKVPYRLVPGIY